MRWAELLWSFEVGWLKWQFISRLLSTEESWFDVLLCSIKSSELPSLIRIPFHVHYDVSLKMKMSLLSYLGKPESSSSPFILPPQVFPNKGNPNEHLWITLCGKWKGKPREVFGASFSPNTATLRRVSEEGRNNTSTFRRGSLGYYIIGESRIQHFDFNSSPERSHDPRKPPWLLYSAPIFLYRTWHAQSPRPKRNRRNAERDSSIKQHVSPSNMNLFFRLSSF